VVSCMSTGELHERILCTPRALSGRRRASYSTRAASILGGEPRSFHARGGLRHRPRARALSALSS
jgi:hypothetical protein